jgi:hypothetical protein
MLLRIKKESMRLFVKTVDKGKGKMGIIARSR